MRNYYAIFDMGQNRIGLTPQVFASAANIELDNNNSWDLIVINETVFYWLGIIWDIIVILAIISIINYFCCKQNTN